MYIKDIYAYVGGFPFKVTYNNEVFTIVGRYENSSDGDTDYPWKTDKVYDDGKHDWLSDVFNDWEYVEDDEINLPKWF